jgi:hypothetical protein
MKTPQDPSTTMDEADAAEDVPDNFVEIIETLSWRINKWTGVNTDVLPGLPELHVWNEFQAYISLRPGGDTCRLRRVISTLMRLTDPENHAGCEDRHDPSLCFPTQFILMKLVHGFNHPWNGNYLWCLGENPVYGNGEPSMESAMAQIDRLVEHLSDEANLDVLTDEQHALL